MSTHAAKQQRPLDLRMLGQQLLFIGFVIGLPLGIGTAPSIFRDGDVSWQVAAGNWILAHGRIPTTDPFSFTAAGHPWVAMEWLAEIVYATAFRIASYAGLATIVAAALIALQALIFFYLQRKVSTVVLTSTLLMLDFALAPFAMARPHVLAWPLLAAWTILLLRAADTGRPPPLWTALILVVWTNLHASWPLAIPVAMAIGLDALRKARWNTLHEWALFSLVSAVALMLNVNGSAGLIQPFKTSNLAMLPLIGEWHRSNIHATPFFFVALLFGAAALCWSRIAVPFGRLLLLLVMLGMALLHVRHQSAFMIVSACVLPPLWPAKPATAPVPKWLLAIAVPALVLRALWPLTPPESEANPRSLIAAVPAELKNQPLFNAYIFGGPLILNGIRPYIDGRAEIYGDSFVTDYVHIANGDYDAFERTVERYDIRWTILPANSRLVDKIESSGKWQRFYSDRVGVIDVRTAPPRPQ